MDKVKNELIKISTGAEDTLVVVYGLNKNVSNDNREC